MTFFREATGLVRALSLTDLVIMSLSLISPLGAFGLTLIGLPFLFPGANFLLVFVLGAIPALAFVLMYSIMSAVMPRSGGDYVWTGRILGPRIATVMAVLFLFSQIVAFQGSDSWGIVYWQMSPALLALGITTSNPGLVSLSSSISQPLTGFIIAATINALVFVIAMLGINFFKTVTRIGFAFYALMTIVFIIVMGTLSASTFQAGFDSAMKGYGLSYASVLATVNKNPSLTTFNLASTVFAIPLLGFLTYSGFNFTTYAAGEMRNVSKNALRSLLISVLVTILLLVTFTELLYNTMGQPFVAGISYLFQTGSLGSLPVEPTVFFLLGLATNPWIGFLIVCGISVSGFLVSLQATFLFARIVFAMSFDRTLPKSFANVSERLHSPWVAVLVVGIVSVGVEALYWYGPGLLTGILNSAIAVEVAYVIPGLAAFLFPFIRKKQYETLVKNLPGWVSAKIGGWPLVSIGGLLVTAIWTFGIFSETVPITTYVYLGSSLGIAALATVAPVVTALLLFEGSRIYHKRKEGIDISLAIKEIPPE